MSQNFKYLSDGDINYFSSGDSSPDQIFLCFVFFLFFCVFLNFYFNTDEVYTDARDDVMIIVAVVRKPPQPQQLFLT